MEVKKDRYGRPTAFCKNCRCQLLVRGEKGAELWRAGKPGTPPEPPRSAPPPQKAAPAPPAEPKKAGLLDGIL